MTFKGLITGHNMTPNAATNLTHKEVTQRKANKCAVQSFWCGYQITVSQYPTQKTYSSALVFAIFAS